MVGESECNGEGEGKREESTRKGERGGGTQVI